MITVKLILSECFPEQGGVWADDNFAAVQVVSLPNKSLEHIDNLDLFDNITELNLRRNKIKIVENVSHLMKLHSMDLSDNLIDAKGLRAEPLPPNLRSVDLSGNPCAASSSVIEKLQEDYPNVHIVTKARQSYPSITAASNDSAATNPATSAASLHSSSSSSSSSLSPSSSSLSLSLSSSQNKEGGYLDSEEVLREVVDRKCRLQALTSPPLDIDSAMRNLEKVRFYYVHACIYIFIFVLIGR
jgi:hypothetical protein